MARAAVDPGNLARQLQRLDRVKQNIMRAAQEEVKRSAENIAQMAQQLAPLGETGDLRNSIRWHSETRISREGERMAANFMAVIGAYVDYAAYVEFGTRFMPARPFLFPALEYEHPIFRATLDERIRAELRKVRPKLRLGAR